MQTEYRPSLRDLRISIPDRPALKRRAILNCSSGTKALTHPILITPVI
jgi:hypothetical protein